MNFRIKHSFICDDGLHGEQEYELGDTVLVKAINGDFMGKIITIDDSEIQLRDKHEEWFTIEFKSIFTIKRTH